MYLCRLLLYRISQEIFVGVYFRYEKPQHEKSTHKNLYMYSDTRLLTCMVRAYNENKTHENTLSRPDNENLTQRKFLAILYTVTINPPP